MIKDYKTIFIDMYGVILRESMGVIPYVYSCFNDSEQERINGILEEKRLIDRLSEGEITDKEFFAELGLHDGENRTKDYIENFLTLDEGFIDFAEKAKDKYELILLSNDASEWSKYITEYYGLDKYFRNKIISAEVKCRKPGFAIFDKALEIVGRSAAECIFVDNSIKNLLAAEEVGISPILFNRDNKHFCGMTVDNFKELADILL